jgi:hypothetical protein
MLMSFLPVATGFVVYLSYSCCFLALLLCARGV